MIELRIILEDEDLDNILYVLTKIAENINDGFTKGIEYPVNWRLQMIYERDKLYELRNLITRMSEIIDSMPHKGNKCEESQKVCLLNAIGKLQSVINGTTLNDFEDE